MKVVAVILLAIALADGKGSGPYLYERPEGRAFFLPSEIVKPLPLPTPVIELNLQGSEASGSDSLREYGPPKVQDISQNLLNQGLPDVTIEQTFGFSAQNAETLSQGVAEKVVDISEVKPEVISTEPSTTASQASLDDNPPISAELLILDFAVKETTTAGNVEQATEIISRSNQLNPEQNVQLNTQDAQESLLYISEQTNQENKEYQTTELSNVQSSEPDSPQPLQYQKESSTASVEQNVPELQNVPDIIASFEKEILSQQAEVKQAVSEIVSVQPLGPVPEGFLEYGPPGFVEYGPPKGDEEVSENAQNIVANETRRRRFSPRLRNVKKLDY